MKKLLAVLVLSAIVATTGCSVAWLGTLENYIKIAGPILIQILDIVSLAKGTPVNPALQAKILADQAAVSKLADSVASASQANLPTTCAAFNQAVATFSGDLSAIEQLANVGPTTAGEIGAAVSIAQAAIQEIEAPLAACQSATPAQAKSILRSAALHVTSPEVVVKRFNAVVDRHHRVHLHSFPVRVITFGQLQ